MPKTWEELYFSKCVKKISIKHKIKTKDYLKNGKYPIVDQSQDFISGYFDDENMLIKTKKPLIVFGDHTRCFKFIDFDFIAGADGIKILEPINKFNHKCFYYFCLALKFENKGYSRHYQYLEKATMRIPPLDTQKQIVGLLDFKFAKIENAANALNLVKKDLVKLKASLLNSAFNGILLQDNGLLRASPRNDTFPSVIASNEVAKQSTNNTESILPHLPQDWEVKTLGEIANTTSGGTPLRNNSSYWGGNIKWLKSGELNDNYIKEVQENIT